MAPRDPHAPVQALSSNNINQREVGPLQAVALGPTEAVALRVESLGRPRRDSAVYKMLSALPAYPVVDVATAQAIAGVSDVAAGRALNAMETANILTNLGARQRERMWECQPLFDLVDDFEADLATAPG